MNNLSKITPFKICVLYLIVGFIWIITSNTFFGSNYDNLESHFIYNTYQANLFILVSGILLYFLLKAYQKQINKSLKLLKENEQLYRTLIEYGGDIIGLTDQNGDIKYLSNGITFKVLGYSKEEMIDKSVFALVHPDDLEKINALHQNLLKNPGILFNEELRILHNEGHFIWIESTSVNHLGNPNIKGIVNNIKVIDDRKRVEEKLKEGEAKNKAILAAIPDIYLIINDEGRYVYTKETEEYVFTPDDSFIGKTLFEVLPPDLAEKAWKNIQQAFLTGKLQIFEHQTNTPKGIQCLETRAIKISSKEVLVMVRNITERYTSEQRIKESEHLFRSTFEQAAVGIAHVGLDMKRIRINKKFCEILGRTIEEIFPLTVKETSHPDDYITEEIFLQQLLNNECQYYQMEKRYLRKDGSYIWTTLTVSLIRDEENKPQYFIAVIQDITNKKLIEEALRYKNKELNTFIYRASHDLKGPITSLMGLAQLGLNELIEKDALEILEKVNFTASKMDVILTNLIDITKIQQGTLTAKPVDFETKINDIIASILHIRPEMHFSIIKQIEPVTDFHSDPLLLRSIIQNLIENSIKYAKDENVDKSFIGIQVQKGTPGVQIRIWDNGIGIKKDQHDKIFEMFYRATEKSKGTGLGLYIVKSAVDKLGGRIEFKSEENAGSEFNIYLPDCRNNLSNQSAILS